LAQKNTPRCQPVKISNLLPIITTFLGLTAVFDQHTSSPEISRSKAGVLLTPTHARFLKMQDRSIKLLTLHPAKDDRTLIKCSLSPHDLSRSPSYEALSYTWGSPTDICPVPIDINGREKFVSTNLEAALRVLRLRKSPRTLWIDALCINQEDDSEKSRQIPLMGSIFASAFQVVIWLGPGDKESNNAMSIIKIISSVADTDHITERGWNALENLFSRTWFKRIWVVQEFKRARNPVFQCGHKSFEWDSAGAGLYELWTSGQSINRTHVKFLGEIGKVVSMASTRIHLPTESNIGTRQAAGHLVKMLRVYGACQATDPHDKIYGLLGLSDSFSFPGCNPPAIEYTKSIEDVYRDWAIFLIETQGTLDLLYISQRMEHDSKLPTWVPDWRKARHDLLLTLDVFQSCFKYAGPQGGGGGGDPTPHFDGDGRYLSIQGFVVTVVKEEFMFSDPDPKFISSKLSSRPQTELLQACLMMGCKLKNAPGGHFYVTPLKRIFYSKTDT
jgi:Heterokaryon incompatibility protein (HET)